MNELLQRLEQRKIVQWSVAYIAAAFALLQGIDIIANRFDFPSQTIRLVILAMIVGFFVTLILAWYYGERGSQKITGNELLRHLRKRCNSIPGSAWPGRNWHDNNLSFLWTLNEPRPTGREHARRSKWRCSSHLTYRRRNTRQAVKEAVDPGRS